MSAWKECKLGDVAKLINGFAFKGSDFLNSGVPVIKIKNVKPGKILLDNLSYVSVLTASEKEKYLINSSDILITMSGNRSDGSPDSWVGKVSLFKVKGQYLLNQRVGILRPIINPISIEYLAFLLSSMEYQQHFINLANSSGGQANISPETILNTKIGLPSLAEQRAIAGVLSSLDDKIDLLHRQNKTLEGMAEALWRKMFVEEADPGWKKGKLGDEMDITMGQSPPGNSYNEEKQGMLFFQGRAEFRFRFPEARLYCTEPKRIAKRYDTLVSVRAPVGDINMASEECCIGRGVAAVRHKNGFVSYTIYKIKSLKDDFDSFEQQGTVFGSIGKEDFNGIDTIVPGLRIVEQFDGMAKALDDKIFKNSFQIRTLSRLRDTLLPKLMSGEVRVKL